MNAALESLHVLRRRLVEQRDQCACTCEHVAAGLSIALDEIDYEIATQQSWETIDQMSPEELDADLRSKGYDTDAFVQRCQAKVAEWAALMGPDEAPVPAPSPLAPVWQPIATAPRDGSYIVIAGPSGYGSTPLRIEVGRYVEGYISPWRNHANDAFEDGGQAPTLWMPLPPV